MIQNSDANTGQILFVNAQYVHLGRKSSSFICLGNQMFKWVEYLMKCNQQRISNRDHEYYQEFCNEIDNEIGEKSCLGFVKKFFFWESKINLLGQNIQFLPFALQGLFHSACCRLLGSI